jgi:hypothetical protein
MNVASAIEPRSQYVDFWNAILVPKFNLWRHVLVGGLSLHSAKVFPALTKLPSDILTLQSKGHLNLVATASFESMG